MSLMSSIANQAAKIAGDVQGSIRRARVEGERRLLQRQHRTALEELGERTYELVKAGRLPADALGPEVAAVEAKLMEIEAKVSEVETMRDDGREAAPDAADVAFPMVSGDGGAGGAGEDAPPSAGPGWDAAKRFFREGS